MSTTRCAPVLTRDGVTLRMLEVHDATAWLAGEDDEQLRWFQMPAAAIDDVVLAIERWRIGWIDNGPLRQWGIWVDRELAGGVELRIRDDGRANLSYVVFPAFRRRGLATAAVELVVEWGLAHLPIRGVVAVIDVENVASRGVVAGAGFAPDGAADPWEHTERGTMVRYMRMP